MRWDCGPFQDNGTGGDNRSFAHNPVPIPGSNANELNFGIDPTCAFNPGNRFSIASIVRRNTASESGGFALLVFPAAIIIFILFHLFMRPK